MMQSSSVIIVALSLALTDAAALPTFVFPEEEDPYFGQNVATIRRSIGQALDSGCLDAWPLEDPAEIAVVFRHDSMVPETSDFYIQYQMEQVAADDAKETAVGFKSLADHVQYKRKLAGALQVWEWSPRQIDFLKTALPEETIKKLAYVPLTADIDAGDSNGCEAVLEETWCQEDAGSDVLFFGAMTESRKQLCNAVDEEIDRLKHARKRFSHQCVSGVFGEALQCKICKAKIIYSDHSREGASLEVHRINPLLAQGKAVVSSKSADRFLDSLYDGAVELVESEGIPKAISTLLMDDNRRMKLEWRGFALVQQLQRKAQPILCQVLRSLASLATEASNSLDSWKREGLQDYVPYMAERRMQTSGNCTNTTINCSVPTPMPTLMNALSKISAGGLAAVVSSDDLCLDAATVPAFNVALAMQASVPVAAVSSSCSSTMVTPPSPSPSPSPSPVPSPSPSPTPSPPPSPALPSSSSNSTGSNSSNSTGGRRLQAAGYFMINMTYVIELTVYPNESNRTSIDLANALTAMSASELQTELVQQLARANKTFNTTTQGAYLVVTAFTAPQTVMVTNVTSNVVVPFLTTTMPPPSNMTNASSAIPSPIPAASPTPAPTPVAPPSPSLTPAAVPSPTPIPTPTAPAPAAPTPIAPLSPTPSAPTPPTLSPTPAASAPSSPTPTPSLTPSPTPSAPPSPTSTAPTPSPVPTPTRTPAATLMPTPTPNTTAPLNEEESGSISMCRVCIASIAGSLASLIL